MEYRNVFERINNVNNINEVCKNICSIYHIGNYISHKIIEIGYEDFNIILNTTDGKYFIKILNKDRTDEECNRLANIYDIARNKGIRVPMIYKSNNKLVTEISIQSYKLRILLMEYIKGSNMYELERNLSLEEIEQVVYQAALINSIDFKVNPYYDEWTITNFNKEYKRKYNDICEEDKEIVKKVYEKFANINLDKLPKSYIHGDIMNANLIKDGEKIWIIDFSVLSYLPRIIELVVMAYGICIHKNREDSIKRINYLLSKYNQYNKITELELDIFNALLNVMGAMSIMQASYIKATSGNFKENQYWIDKGKEAISLNLTRNEIEL
ncbi:MAG: phosphotransferase [Clostridia bacterium]|nr:phosphotransferase [Clostridia bacterium]